MNFLADLRDKVAVKESMEVLRIAGSGFREHELVNELVDWASLHIGGDRTETFGKNRDW
ncbi:hypothetical protein PC116_g32162 [Phytophthora cactorum]|nr:hypothetical protein PC116_g32162 [Phytophthora cactorum]